jgi:hypothetical protein
VLYGTSVFHHFQTIKAQVLKLDVKTIKGIHHLFHQDRQLPFYHQVLKTYSSARPYFELNAWIFHQVVIWLQNAFFVASELKFP